MGRAPALPCAEQRRHHISPHSPPSPAPPTQRLPVASPQKSRTQVSVGLRLSSCKYSACVLSCGKGRNRSSASCGQCPDCFGQSPSPETSCVSLGTDTLQLSAIPTKRAMWREGIRGNHAPSPGAHSSPHSWTRPGPWGGCRGLAPWRGTASEPDVPSLL